jgi:hypothetical protein
MEQLNLKFETEKKRTAYLKKLFKIQEADPNKAASKVDTQWDKNKWQMVKPHLSQNCSPSNKDFYCGRLKSDTLVS